MKSDDDCRRCGAPIILRRVQGKNKTVMLDAEPVDDPIAGFYAVGKFGKATKIEGGRLVPDETTFHSLHKSTCSEEGS